MNSKTKTDSVVHCQIVRSISVINILICDDDLGFLKRMQNLVEIFLGTKGIKATLYTFSDAQKISPQILKSIDIAFLDIDFEQKHFNGLDLAKKLRFFRKDAVIIFVTNFIEYAPDGYEVQAFRYLLKRQINDGFPQYLDLAISHLKRERDTVKFQISGEIIDVPLVDILYFEVYQHSVTMHLRKNGQKSSYKFYASLSDLEERLSSRGFLRVHNSYLVNMQYILKFQCRQVTLQGGVQLRVSEKNYAENKQKYLLWRGWQG